MIRPHRIRIEAAGGGAANRLAARMVKTIYVGDIVQYQARIGGTMVLAERGTAGPGWSGLEPESEVSLAWEVADTLVFEEAPAQ
jgi:hypothetical protein